MNVFTSHPHKTGETYIQHLSFTVWVFFYLVVTAFAALIHGIFPFLCSYTASRRMKNMHDILQARVAMAEQRTAQAH